MKDILITLLVFTMLVFNACEVINCTSEADDLLANEWGTGELSDTYNAYIADISDDTADSTDSGFGATYKEACQDYVDILQTLIDAECQESTEDELPGYTQANADYYQSVCDNYYDSYDDIPDND